jgi:predicted secreted hydrolase
MWSDMRKLGPILLLLLIVKGAFWYVGRPGAPAITGSLSAVAAASGTDDPRWERVTEPRPFTFPQDHGAHPEYQTEWWYYTGNLEDDQGRAFGFQFTIFRRGLDPEPVERASRWATRNIYLAHFTVSDLDASRFYASERFSRDGAGLAGTTSDPFRVWLGEWQALGSGPEGMTMDLQATGDEMAIDLRLESTKAPVLQGDQGYSPKGQGIGNASYYYSLTRMATTGTLTIGGTSYRITSGTSWMDHEWGTSRLESNAVGWDWFALILDDGRELTWAQLRDQSGQGTADSFGSLTNADGTTTPLRAADVQLEVLDTWDSPRSGARYPAAWRLRVPGAGLDLEIRPRLADQELPVSIVYWEGAVSIEGEAGDGQPVDGVGYVELTGYVPSTGGGTLR